MATTWSPVVHVERNDWLLMNGEVVREPALEQTPSGRKMRVAGTNLTCFTRDMDTLLLGALKRAANDRNTEVWMPLTQFDQRIRGELGYKPEETRAELYLLNSQLTKTVFWWRFRHPTLPVEAYLTVRSDKPDGWSSTHTVSSTLTMPRTDQDLQRGPTRITTTRDQDFSNVYYFLSDPEDRQWQEFVRDNPPEWVGPLLRNHDIQAEKVVIQTLLTMARAADDLQTITVPDLRDLENPGWLELELHGTNFNGSVLSDMQDYLEGSASVNETLRLYNEFREGLRAIGVVLEERTEDHFHQALLSGDRGPLTVQVLSGAHDEEGVDSDHTLTMHLPTGTFVVNCSAAGKNAVADRWEEVHTVASLTGEEDVLLAFAREYVRTSSEKRARKIINKRKTP